MGGWGTPASTSEHDHHTVRKREQLLRCPRTRLVPHASVAAVVAVGSVAADLARADPDIDAVVFMDPLDLHVAPTEAVWRPADDTYRSIFAADAGVDDVQLDLTRLDLRTWREPGHHWPEHLRAALARSDLEGAVRTGGAARGLNRALPAARARPGPADRPAPAGRLLRRRPRLGGVHQAARRARTGLEHRRLEPRPDPPRHAGRHRPVTGARASSPPGRPSPAPPPRTTSRAVPGRARVGRGGRCRSHP